MALHMIKLCVGCDTVDDLIQWKAAEADGARPWTMQTRQTPKRAAEMLDGGSLYRVFKGAILCRQTITGIKTIGEGPNSRCIVTLDPELVLVAPTPRRAFQGWRYLAEADAPPDLGEGGFGDAPPELARQLREIGAW